MHMIKIYEAKLLKINLFLFNLRIIALQNFFGFCQTSTSISHRYTYVPSLLNLSHISERAMMFIVGICHSLCTTFLKSNDAIFRRQLILNFLKNVFVFNWKIIALQYCVGFCHTSTWISHRYTYVPSLLNFPPTSHPIPAL